MIHPLSAMRLAIRASTADDKFERSAYDDDTVDAAGRGPVHMDQTSGGRDGLVADEPYVFVSYARADEKQAKAIIKSIDRAGFRVWWDALIPSGDRFSARIAEALEGARAIVVLWSVHSIDSVWVQDEAGWGRDHHRLVPISIDGSDPPLGFRQLQCVNLAKGGLRVTNPEMQRALRAIAEMLDHPPPDFPRAPLVDRRSALIGGSAAAAAAVAFGVWRYSTSGSAANSLAVLPFQNLSGDASKQYLSDGVAAELRATLARNPLLRVVGQASSNNFRNSTDDSRGIARKLDVTSLLDGNVLVAGNMIRIAVELVEGRTGFSRWSQKFERPLENILTLQDDVATAVDAALSARLSGSGRESQARSGGTKNVAAFDAYLRGKDLFDSQRDEASDRGSLAAFTEAVQLDPNYAAARAARSRALAVIANEYAQAADRRPLYQQAVDEARRAVAAAPQFADAFAALGYALFYGKLDIIAADGPYEKARQFGSGSADVLGLYAIYRARRRQFDRAGAAIAAAATLDPVNPTVFKNRGRISFAAGDYDAAIAAARRALDLNPDIGAAHGDIGNALLLQGKAQEAAAEFAKEKVQLLAVPGRAFVALREGNSADAQRAFDELVKAQGDNGLYQQAQILAQWNKIDQALGVLDKCVEAQDSGLVYLISDPFLAPLKDEPRFKSLLRRLHFV
jgi:TolB-like protein/Tfp pilus assembly protein PilF